MYLTVWPQKGTPYTCNMETDEGTLVSVHPAVKGRKEVHVRTRTLVPRRIMAGDPVRLDYPIDRKHASGIILNIFERTILMDIGPTVNNA